MIIILLICTIVCSIFSSSTSELSLKRLRLKNGSVLISSSFDDSKNLNMIGLFFKHGSTLKFNKKTGFSALAQEVLSSRLKKLAKDIGFRYRAYLDWDYLYYTLYLPSDVSASDLFRIWSALYGDTTISDMDFAAYKGELGSLIKYEFDRKAINSSMIGFLSHHKSIYSIGKYGSVEDVNSIQKDEFNSFLRCYANPNNSIIVLSSKNYESIFKNSIASFKPCFMDERFSNESMVNFIVPGRSVAYLKSSKKNFTIRLGFPSVSCSRKESLVYDLISQLLIEDEVISSLSGQVYIENNCYLDKGVLEIVLANVKKDPDEIVTKLIQRLSFLSSSLDQSELINAKNDLNKMYSSILNDKESFISLIGKSYVYFGAYSDFINYKKRLDVLGPTEVRDALKTLNYENMFNLYLKQE